MCERCSRSPYKLERAIRCLKAKRNIQRKEQNGKAAQEGYRLSQERW
jgi:hypothetical protein